MAERLRIRPARIDECESLADLARRSKASWGYDAGFMRACHDELGVSTVAVAAGSVFVAEWGGVVVGERVSASIPGRVLPLFEMLLPGEPG